MVNCVCSWSHSVSSYSWRSGLSSWTGKLSRRGVCPISTRSWNWKKKETRSVWMEGLKWAWTPGLVLTAGSVNGFCPMQTFYQALHSRDSLQLEYTDCLLDKNRLRKRIAELQANLEQQQRELERERERSREQMEQSTSCLHCVS